MFLALFIAMQSLVLAGECAPISPSPQPPRKRLPGERQSGFMKCQCKLEIEVDGEVVRVCDGFNIKPGRRSVSLVGFPEGDIRKMLVEFGYIGWSA